VRRHDDDISFCAACCVFERTIFDRGGGSRIPHETRHPPEPRFLADALASTLPCPHTSPSPRPCP
jgi:hypothetical protein